MSMMNEDVKFALGNQQDAPDTYRINVPAVDDIKCTVQHRNSDSSEEDIYMEDLTPDGVASKPLMYPRQRVKVRAPRTMHGSRRWQRLLWPLLYTCMCVAALIACACLILFFVNTYGKVRLVGSGTPNRRGCSHVQVQDVWVVGIPKLTTESAFRLLDVNEDGVLDIIFGFGTGAEGYNVPPVVCDIYFNGSHPCQGGVQALDGSNGKVLWNHFTAHEVFAVTCNGDLDGDGVNDCIVAGRMAVMEAVSGHDGHMLWNFSDSSVVSVMNVYTAQFIEDLDGDGVLDILNVHGGDPFGEPGSKNRLPGRLYLLSGRHGEVLRWAHVPDMKESYYSPVIYSLRDGTRMILFGTGGETHGGALWVVALNDLYKGQIAKAKAIFHDSHKGVMTPPVLMDLTGDTVDDIIFAAYNSSLLAFDGESLELLWNFTYPFSETYASPAPGYYNDDDVPDFMITWQYGPGFPVYYHSVVTVVDGKTGKALLEPYIKSTVGAQTSPLTISMEGQGNDLFLYWMADCRGHEAEGGDFTFVKGTNVHEKSRSDVCKLRFKTNGFSRMYAVGGQVAAPGAVIYDSTTREKVEHSAWVNSTAEAQHFLQQHPEHQQSLQAWHKFIDEHQHHHHQHQDGETSAEDSSSHNLPSTGERGHTHTLSDYPYDQGYDSYQQNGEQDRDYYGNRYQTDRGSDYAGQGTQPQGNRADSWPQGYRQDGYRPAGRLQGYSANDRPQSYRSNSRPQDYKDDPRPESYRPSQASGYTQQHYKPRSRAQDSDYQDIDDMWAQFAERRRPPAPGKRRYRRHVGPHDEGGLQRLISTGTLVPPLLEESDPAYSRSMDVVFATYWFFSAKTEVLLPEDQKCLDRRMQEQDIRFDPNSQYYGLDDDGYEHTVTHECLSASGHQLPDNGTYQSQHSYNPYDVHMGQMTVYRVRVQCTCSTDPPSPTDKDAQCSSMLPFTQQQWPAYMGLHADSHWQPRRKPDTH